MFKYKQVKDANYFADVMRNFTAGKDKRDIETVEFGEMGKGVNPNYQIRGEAGSARCYSGQNHKEYLDGSIPDFKPENLAPPLNYDELTAELARCRGKIIPKP